MGVINDYEAIKIFRRDLLDAVNGLNEQLRKTEAAMDEVAAVWKDYQFQKWYTDFNEDKEIIPPLCNRLELYEGDVLYPLQVKLKHYLDL